MKWKLSVLFVFAAALAFWFFGSRNSSESVMHAEQKSKSATFSQNDAILSAETKSPAKSKIVAPELNSMALDDQAEAMRKAWAQYPPDSRPLEANHWDIIEPRITPSGARRLVSTKKGDPHVANYECTLQPQINHVARGEVELITLLCSTLTNPQDFSVEPVRVTPMINSVSMTLHTPSTTTKIDRAFRFNDDGRDGDEFAGDKFFTLAFKPQESDWGEIIVMVNLSLLEEGGQHEYTLQTSFSVSPTAPATFSGRATDRLENGSLMVDVELKVNKAGRYRIYGNLKSGEDYIAYSKEDLQLEKGTQTVALRYFGKIFHDMKAHDGAFNVVDIRGYRFNLADNIAEQAEPEREEIPPFPADYTTARYNLSDFSTQKYSAPNQ